MDKTSDPVPEFAEHIESQERAWRVQRIGWGVLAATLLAAVLGGLGPGLLGQAREQDGSGLLVEYDRFIRYEAPNSIQIVLPPSDSAEQTFLLDASWLHEVHLENVQPEPLRTRSEGDRVRYTFSVQRGVPTRVTMQFEPDGLGTLSGGVALESGTGLAISQFVYP